MKAEEQRLLDEKKFHNEIFSSNARTTVNKYYSINRAIESAYEKEILSDVKGKDILEYGCGMGSRLIQLAKNGASTYGIDISDYAIRQLNEEAKKNNVQVSYLVMNAENLEFPKRSFDIIYGSGILHHLDLEKSFLTLADKLKNTGKAIFIEPLGHNPLINGFRSKTPNLRTEDEHPLLISDFKLAKKYFKKITVTHFYLTTLALPVLFGLKYPKFLVPFFNGIDKVIFALMPFLKKYSWQVLIKLEKPIH